GDAQKPAVQTELSQSDATLHGSFGAQRFIHTAPPQSMPVSSPSFTPLMHASAPDSGGTTTSLASAPTTRSPLGSMSPHPCPIKIEPSAAMTIAGTTRKLRIRKAYFMRSPDERSAFSRQRS